MNCTDGPAELRASICLYLIFHFSCYNSFLVLIVFFGTYMLLENLNESGTHPVHIKCQQTRVKCYQFRWTLWRVVNIFTHRKKNTANDVSLFIVVFFFFFVVFVFLLMIFLSVSLQKRYYCLLPANLARISYVKWFKNPIRTWKFFCSTM